MPVNEKFLAARAAEQHRRLLTHVGVAAPIVLADRQTGVKTRIPLSLLTERHRLELALAENSFFKGRRPLLGDVFLFLWRLYPHFIRHDGTCPNQPKDRRRATWVRRFSCFMAKRRLKRLVRRCDLFAAQQAIDAWLDQAEQDAEIAAPARKIASRALPPRCYPDDLVYVLGRAYLIPPGEIIDLPVALINQLQRSAALATEDGPLMVSAPSDALLAEK